MNSDKTILVTGATGAQGGSVAYYLKKAGRFNVRGLSRDPESKKAAGLKEEGVEVVKGDLDDVESLLKAMQGCYGVFGVTNFWEHFLKEAEQGKNLIDAAKESNIKHLVLSTLPSISKVTKGELKSPHFDIKAEHEDYARKLKINSTFIHVAFYYENFLTFFPLKKGDDGNFHFGFPQGDTLLNGVSSEDVGGVVAPVFENPELYVGKTIPVLGDLLQSQTYADILSQVLGVKVIYDYIPREVFAKFGFPGAEEIADMFEFYRKYSPYDEKDLAECRKIFPGIKTFETWMKASKEAFAPHLK